MIAAAPAPSPALDEPDLRQLCLLVSRGCTVPEAARCLGLKLADLRHERDTNDRFRRKLARAKMKARLAPLRAMQKAMLKDWRAAAWLLERTQPEKFARRNHRAFTQKQAAALVQDVARIVAEEVASKPATDRLNSRLEAAIRYACHAHNDTHRTAAQLRRAMHHHAQKTPLASSASSNPPPITPPPPHTPARPTPPPSTGRTIAQMIVDTVDQHFATTHNPPPPPLASSASSNPPPTMPTPRHSAA